MLRFSENLRSLVARLQTIGEKSRGKNLRQLHERPSRDDVLNAFRLILGRELNNEAAVAAHMNLPSVSELRRVLLKSDEFKGRYRAMHPDALEHPDFSSDRRTIVFYHLQKTGGTSLREVIGRNFSLDRRCPILENKLHVLSLAELARYDFFAGHFDVSCIPFIPRNNIETIGLFREPHARLISFYRFLRSHPSDDEFAGDRLMELARNCGPAEFFEQPELRFHSSLNNHYLFALGRSFLWFDRNREVLTEEMLASVLLDAKLQIRALAALGVTERFDESVNLICHALLMKPPSVVDKKHVTDDLATVDARFSAVESVMMTPRLSAAMHDLVRYDTQLYQFAVIEFERRFDRAFGTERNHRIAVPQPTI